MSQVYQFQVIVLGMQQVLLKGVLQVVWLDFLELVFAIKRISAHFKCAKS